MEQGGDITFIFDNQYPVLQVTKVESPTGDDTRTWGPPWINVDGEQCAAYFHACNRGKQSIVADLKTEDGVNTVKELLKDADVMNENFKLGGLKQYGLDAESLHEEFP
ncbi:MAG: CoA transferase, partial [Pseudomonadota bacterium]